MNPLKEFANFITQNKATLAGTYARLLAEREAYSGLPDEGRVAAGRKLLNGVIEACETASHDPLTALFISDNGAQQPRWGEGVEPPQPIIEVECLGEALNPVITNLEAGKFLWQMLADVRQALFDATSPVSSTPSAPTPLPVIAPEPDAQQETSVKTPVRDEEHPPADDLLLYVRNRAIEATIDPISIVDARQPDFPLIYVNPAFEQVTGYAANEILGKNCRFLQNDDRNQPGLAEIRTALNEGRSCTVTLRNYRKDGTLFWNELQLSPVYDDRDVLTHYIGVQNDITEQKETQDALAKLATELETVARVSAAVSTILDPDELLQRVVNLTKESFGLYHVHIYLFDESEQMLNSVAGAGHVGGEMVGPDWHIPLGREGSLVAQVARSRQGQIVNDVHDISNFYPHPHLPDTQSEMAVPLTISDKLWGVLDVQHDVPNAFTAEDRHVHTTLATEIAVALENAHAYEEIEREHAQVEALAKQLDDIRFALDQHSIVAITDPTGIITYVNDKFCEVSKYAKDELLGQDHRIVNSGYHPKSFIQDLWDTITTGQVWKGEIKNRAKDDTIYWVDTTIVPILNAQGQPIQYVAIRTDITQTKKYLAEIEQRAAELETVAQVSTAISTILTPAELLQQVADLVKASFNLYHAHIYLLEGNRLELVAGAGEVGRQMTREGWHIPLAASSLVAQAARTREPVIVNDVQNEADFLPNPLLPDTRAEMAVPMLVVDRVVGVLDVQADTPDYFTTNDTLVQMTLASQIAIALENARLFEEMNERATRETTLREITGKLQAAPTLEILLETAARELGQRLGARHTVLELGIEAPSQNGEKENDKPFR